MRALPPDMIPPLSPKRAAPRQFNPEFCGNRYPPETCHFLKSAVDAPRQVRLRDKIFWSLSGNSVHSVRTGQSPGEVLSCTVKILGELGAATGGVVLNLAFARHHSLNLYSAANPPRREVVIYAC